MIYLKLFIDESGSTGLQKLVDNSWNFKVQPYFVLTGILLDNSAVQNIDSHFCELIKQYRIQGELKYKNKGHRKYSEELIPVLYDLVKSNNGTIFIEVVNKKFDICKWITEYCFWPYYDNPHNGSVEGKIIRRSTANYVYENVKDNLLNEFLSIADSDVLNVNSMVEYCNELLKEVENELLRQAVYETVDSIKKYKELGMQPHNVFPVKDVLTNGETVIAVSPNVDSYNNIIKRCLGQNSDLIVVHDKQSQFCNPLIRWTDYFNEIESEKSIELKFSDSRSEPIIQIADYFAGYIRDMITNSVPETVSSKGFAILSNTINIVSSYKDTGRVLPNNAPNIQEYKWHKRMYL